MREIVSPLDGIRSPFGRSASGGSTPPTSDTEIITRDASTIMTRAGSTIIARAS